VHIGQSVVAAAEAEGEADTEHHDNQEDADGTSGLHSIRIGVLTKHPSSPRTVRTSAGRSYAHPTTSPVYHGTNALKWRYSYDNVSFPNIMLPESPRIAHLLTLGFPAHLWGRATPNACTPRSVAAAPSTSEVRDVCCRNSRRVDVDHKSLTLWV
jgi:hypothetical protein